MMDMCFSQVSLQILITDLNSYVIKHGKICSW